VRVKSTIAVLVAALAALALGLPSPAMAVGTGDPVIVSPSASDALYAGYTGPFRFDFENAPQGDYDWSVVSTTNQPPAVVDQGTYPNDGVGVPEPVSTSPLAAGTYTFTISNVATPALQDSVDFTVKPGPPPKCSLVVPTKVRVNASLVKVTGRLNSVCATLDTKTADWKVTHHWQVYDYYRFSTNTTDTWSLYDGDPTGSYPIVPLSALSNDSVELPQNSPTVQVRRDSRLVLSGSRSGSTVTLRTALSYYSASTHGYRHWADKYVALAYRTCSTCAWHSLSALTTDASGRASYTFKAASSRVYRVRSSGTSQVWDALPRYLRI